MSLILGTPKKKYSTSSPRTPNTPHTPRPRDLSHTPEPDIPPPSEPFVHFNTVTIPFPNASTSKLVEVRTVDFPDGGGRTFNEGMVVDEEEEQRDHGSEGQDDWDLASSSAFLPEVHTLARVIGNGQVLELRYIAPTTQRALRSNNETLIRINFPRALRSITNSHCLCLTTDGNLAVIVIDDQCHIYRTIFPNPAQAIEEGNAFRWNPEQARSGWANMASMELESSGMSVEGRVRLIWEAVDEESVLVAGNDGLIGFKLNGDFWQPNYFKIQNSAFFTFSSSTIGPHNRIISLKRHNNHIYCVTRDKRLRIFSMQTGLMVNMIDLEDRGSAAEERARKSVGKQSDEDILDNSLIQIVEDDQAGHLRTIILLFNSTPDDVDAAGGFRLVTHTADQGWELPGYASASVGSGGKAFRGMHLERHAYGSGEQEQTYWRLWVTWEERDGASLEYVDMTGILEPSSGKEAIRSSEWLSVQSLKKELKLEPIFDAEYWDTAVTFDDLQEGEDMWDRTSDVFVKHLFYPGRYSMRVLQDCYEEAVAGLDNAPDESSAESLKTRTAWAVESGCGVTYDEVYEDAGRVAELKKAWVAYWYKLKARDSLTRAPVTTAFVTDGQSTNPILIDRDGVTIPVLADAVSVLRSLVTAGEEEVDAEGSDAGMASLSAESDLESFKVADNLGQFYPSLASGPSRVRAVNAMSAVEQYAHQLSRSSLSAFAVDALVRLSSEDDSLDVATWAEETVDMVQETSLASRTSAAGVQRTKGMDIGDVEALLDLVDSFGTGHASVDGQATYTGAALSVSSMADVTMSRCLVATQILLFLLATIGETQHDAERGGDADGNQYYILKRAATTYLNLAHHAWLAEQDADESRRLWGKHEPAGYNLEAFKALLNESGGGVGGFEADDTAYSLLHTLAACPATQWRPSTALLAAITHGRSLSAIASIGFLGSSRHVGPGITEARLGLMLLQSGNPYKAVDMLERFPVFAAGLYVAGRAKLILLEEGPHLLKDFMKAVVPLGRRNWQMNDKTGLAVVLPYEVQRSGKAGYYRHLRNAFLAAGRVQDAMACAELALRRDPAFDPTLSSWLFTAALETEAFENALSYMLRDPKYANEGYSEPVMAFVKALCNTNQFDLVFELNIDGLEADIQQALDLLSRNAHPLEYPAYHRILYGWAARREDWRLAGIAAYQQADRVSLLKFSGREDYTHLWKVRAELLLLAKSALSQVEPAHAAFSQPAMNRSHGILAARISNNIPTERYTDEVRRELELVTYDVVLREANLVERTLHLAKLTNAQLDPTLEYTPSYVVGRLAKAGRFDEAFAMAKVQRLDLTPTVEALVDQCLILTGEATNEIDSSWLDEQHVSVRWRGSPAERGWRYLQSALQRYDRPIQPDPRNVYGVKVSTGTDFDYHLAAFRRILAKEPNTYIQPWLLQHLIAKCPDSLIREALKVKEVGKAAEWAKVVLEHVQQSPVQTLPGGVIKPQYTPFTSIDQVVAAAQVHRNAAVADLGNSLKEDAQRRANAVRSLMTTITTTR